LLLNATKTWLGIWNQAFIPMWFIEGLAEYYTEEWRVHRSDARMKIYTYKNIMNRLDPHDDGYAKVLYLAEKYGDSTLTKIVNHRQTPFGIYNFEQAFHEATGQTVGQFHEEWRRAMNTYYYSHRGQKEQVADVGKTISIPGIPFVNALAFSPDSITIAVIGRTSGNQGYASLFLVATDSTRTKTTIHTGSFSGMPAWAPDGESIIVSEYHRGNNGSLVYDLRKISVDTYEKSWLTEDMRAHRPVVSSDGKAVYFSGGNGKTSQLFQIGLDGSDLRHFGEGVEQLHVNDPALSPDGKWLAVMVQDASGNVDIGVMDSAGGQFRKLTDDPEEDLLPVWTSDGDSIIFTSYRNSTPNLFKLSFHNPENLRQMTDVVGGIYSQQRMPNSGDIVTSTLRLEDTTQVVIVNPRREIEQDTSLVINEKYRSWRTRQPENPLPESSVRVPNENPWQIQSYRFWKNPRRLGALILPTPAGVGGFGAWNDPLGERFLFAGGLLGYPPYSDQLFDGYLLLFHSAVHRPFITMGFVKNGSLLAQPYDQGILIEARTGGFIQAILPMNGGNSLYSNHRWSLQFRAFQNNSEWFGNEPENRPKPESGKTSEIALRYRYMSRKPDGHNYTIPSQGWGLASAFSVAAPKIYGEYDYRKFKFDAFLNQQLPGPFIFFSRGYFGVSQGNYPVQESPAISNDMSLYVAGRNPEYLLTQPLLETRENFQLRGNTEVVTGDQLLYTSTEIRMAFLPALPVNVFGIRIGSSTLAGFLDSGIIWKNSENQRITTAGMELKTMISIGGEPVIHLGSGFGNTLRAWQNKSALNYFFRMALVSPF